MKRSIKYICAASLSFILITVPTIVLAHDGSHDDAPSDETRKIDWIQTEKERSKKMKELRERYQKSKKQQTEVIQNVKSNLREPLDGEKKKICQQHQSRINQIIDQMNQRRQKAFDRITQVLDAVIEFTKKEQVTAVNLDSLVSSAKDAKAIAETAMNQQKKTSHLDCDSDQPRADMMVFRQKRLESVSAMTSYRDTVKNLVKAVREAVLKESV